MNSVGKHPTSEEIRKEVLAILSDQEAHRISDIKQRLSKSDYLSEFSEGQIAGVMNVLVKNKKADRVERGMYRLRVTNKQKKCFIVYSIGDKDSEVRRHSDKLYRHIIKPVCDISRLLPVRIDKLNQPDLITDNIVEHLSSDDVVIADITGKDPNVFYEIGYRIALRLPIILVRKKDADIPFDVSAIRVFDYSLVDLDMVDELKIV